MAPRVDRRQFLKTTGSTVAASLSLAVGDLAARRPAESPDVGKKPRLMVGCCAYSFRQYLEAGKMSMEDFIHKGVELGCQGVDMTAYWWKSTDPLYVASLRHLAFQNGMPFSGVACGSSMVQAEEAKRQQVLADMKKWIDATDRLGAPHLRIFGGKLPAGATVAQATDWCVAIMKPACDYAGAKGITLGLEDHDGITQTAEVCLKIIQRVNSPYGGINLDITHFVGSSDDDRYRQIEACIPYATHTHIRDQFDDHRPIDLDRVWRLFAQHGYKGYMSAEYEGQEDPMTGVPKLIERIRTLCRKYSTV